MIAQLRRKIVWMTVGVLFLLVLLANMVTHLSVVYTCGQLTEQLLAVLAESDEGVRGESQIKLEKGPLLGTLILDKEALVALTNTPLYGAELDREGQLRVLTDFRGEEVSPETAGVEKVIRQAAQRAVGGGRCGGFRYYKVEKPYGYYVAMMDSSQGLETLFSRHLLKAMAILGVPILLVVILISIFLSKLILRPAVAAFEKQKQFISDAGHELKTPLAAISVNAAVLQDELGENKYMDCIRSEAERMQGLIRQMLDVACLEDGAETPEQRIRFSLSEVVYQSALPFESMAFEQNIRYTMEIPEGCGYTGDPARIRQLMAILLDNAFKYGRSGGEVSVKLQREGRRFVIEVYNTGQGISREDLPHIFERFYRCDKVRPGNGSYGLGLAIAQSIVQGCRGTLTAESEYGAWARFRVTL